MFVYKTPAEFEALSQYEQEKYLDQKKAHEAEQAKENAKKTAKETVEEMRKEIEEENEKQLRKLIEENEKAMLEQAEKHGQDIEELKEILKRAKVGEINARLKGMPEHIVEKLSTPDGEAMIKGFFAGQKEKLNFEVDADTLKAPISVPTGGVAPEFIPIVGPGHDDIHVRNLVPVFPTVSDIIKFVQFTYTNGTNAGFGTVAAGAAKPELAYTSAIAEAPVRKIAGWLDVPDEVMDDIVGFRAWIAYELPKAYLDAEDMQFLKGDGTGTNILGLWTQASYQTLPWGTVTVASNKWDKTIAAITEIRTRKRSTSAGLVSPLFYMEYWINKSSTNEYTYPIIMGDDGVLRVAGVPVYWSNVFTGYQGLVGDFARGASIHQRKAMTIAYSGENKDNFVKNIVTIRLEGRVALAIRIPAAFLRLNEAIS